jgi:hypothetical protein
MHREKIAMPQFSRSTIIELVEALAFKTHAEITKFVLRFGIDGDDHSRGLEPRSVGIIHFLIQNEDKRGPLGANIVYEIADYLLEEKVRRSRWRDELDPEEMFPRLVRSLWQDGYTIVDGELQRSFPESLELAEPRDELFLLIDTYRYSTARGHLEQAISAHTRGDWASANSQLRSFVESLFDSIAETLLPAGTPLPATSHLRREALTRLTVPFIRIDLNEWEPNGKGGFVQGLWNRLHPEGSHSGLSDEEDSTFRLHFVLLAGSHYMRRLHSRLGGSP